MTRGRHANHAYVITEPAETETDRLGRQQPSTAQEILATVLQQSGAEPSAHQAERQEHEKWESLPQLVGEYHTIAQASRPGPDEYRELIRHHQLRRPSYIAGIIPEPTWPLADEYAVALAELRHKTLNRVAEIIQRDTTANAPWLKAVPPDAVTTIAAYRDLAKVASDHPLGPSPADPALRTAYARAKQALAGTVKPTRLPPPDIFGGSLAAKSPVRGL